MGPEAMLAKLRSGTSRLDRSSSMSPMSWKRYAASMSCAHARTLVSIDASPEGTEGNAQSRAEPPGSSAQRSQ